MRYLGTPHHPSQPVMRYWSSPFWPDTVVMRPGFWWCDGSGSPIRLVIGIRGRS
jgi:hypothetical protein